MKLNARNSFSLKSDTDETGGIIKINEHVHENLKNDIIVFQIEIIINLKK